MSRHWNPKRTPARSQRGSRRSPAFSAGEIRLTLLGGVFVGLAYVSVPTGGVASGISGGAGGLSVVVIDGDTFDYRGDRIRIADIDTPELHPSRCAREAELGARATERLEALLAAGPFELEPADRDEDRYGRKLRIVMRDGESIGGMLVAEGLARPWEGRRRSWCG